MRARPDAFAAVWRPLLAILNANNAVNCNSSMQDTSMFSFLNFNIRLTWEMLIGEWYCVVCVTAKMNLKGIIQTDVNLLSLELLMLMTTEM